MGRRTLTQGPLLCRLGRTSGEKRMVKGTGGATGYDVRRSYARERSSRAKIYTKAHLPISPEAVARVSQSRTDSDSQNFPRKYLVKRASMLAGPNSHPFFFFFSAWLARFGTTVRVSLPPISKKRGEDGKKKKVQEKEEGGVVNMGLMCLSEDKPKFP